ncbi:MAG: magnesium transporter [Desulfatiglandaceae bacterium]
MSFKIRGLEAKLIDDVKRYIAEEDTSSLSKIIDSLCAADLADLVEHLDSTERMFIVEFMTPANAGEMLVEVEAPVQEKILRKLDSKAISEIIQRLASDDAADLVGDLPPEILQEIIARVSEDVSRDLEKLLPFDEDSAGGIMALEFVAVDENATVQDAIEVIRSKREEVGNLYHVWVVDRFQRLVGVVSLKDLVISPPGTQVREIMNPEVISVDVSADQEEVVHLVRKYDLVNIPVVDQHRRLVGRITYDDILDALEEEVDEDFSLMAGVIDQEITEESTIKISRARLPWLVAGLLGGILAAAVINHFEDSLQKLVALAFFFPVIMAMAGNTATQAATVVVRGLATGDISLVHIGRRLLLEVKVALINGIICGLLLGLIAGTWLGDYRLGAVMTLSMVLIVLFSGFIGCSVPITLKRLNADPALGTGPFVTTSNDILGLFIYLGLMTLFFKYFS